MQLYEVRLIFSVRFWLRDHSSPSVHLTSKPLTSSAVSSRYKGSINSLLLKARLLGVKGGKKYHEQDHFHPSYWTRPQAANVLRSLLHLLESARGNEDPELQTDFIVSEIFTELRK